MNKFPVNSNSNWMNLTEAKRELWLRVYAWAKVEWERKIYEFFPHLRLFKTGHAWCMYQYMRKLDRADQLALAFGRLKVGHQETAEAWGDQLQAKEATLCRKLEAFEHLEWQFRLVQALRREGRTEEARTAFDASCAAPARVLFETDSLDVEFLSRRIEEFFATVPLSFEQQVAARRLAGEKLKFVSKRRLQETLGDMFRNAFAGEFVEFRIDDCRDSRWTSFDMKFSGWLVTTQFFFGRGKSELSHRHIIQSETRIQHPQNPAITGPAMSLCNAVVWPCGWGWEYLLNGDVEEACKETLKYCRYFFDAAPKLLSGLEYNRVSRN